MKNIICSFFAIIVMSCGSSSKAVKSYEKTIKGNWNIDNISSTVIGDLDFKIFGNTSRSCLIGSSWEFIPNNNSGFYTASGQDCGFQKNYFKFTIEEIDSTSGFYDFLLKPTNSKGRSETNQGFRLELISLTQTKMVWKQTVEFENKPLTLTFNFYKQ